MVDENILIKESLKEKASVNPITGQSVIKTEEEEIFTPEYNQALAEEIALEKEYGEGLATVRTFLERTGAAATFGLSDKVAVKAAEGLGFGKEMKEGLRQRARLNPKTRFLGEITGVAAPLLLSGGVGVLGQMSRVGGAGVIAAAKAGKAIENITYKGLSHLVGSQAKKKVARDVLLKGISKGAGSSVEGFAFATGQLISETELGDKEFNAENVLAYGGSGALWGGLIGAGFGMAPAAFRGVAEIAVPIIKNNRIVKVVSKKLKSAGGDYFDKVYNSLKMVGVDDVTIDKLRKSQPEVTNNIPTMLRKMAKSEGLGIFSRPISFHRAIETFKTLQGKRISKILKSMDEVEDTANYFPTRKSLATKVQSELDDLRGGMVDEHGRPLKGTKSDQIKAIEKEADKWDDDLVSEAPYSATGLYKLKRDYDSNIPYQKGKWTIKNEIDRRIADVTRQAVYDIAANSPAMLGKKLREAMLNVSTAKTFLRHSEAHIKSPKKWIDERDILMASMLGSFFGVAGPAATGMMVRAFAKSDMYNRMMVLTGVEASNQASQSIIKKAAKRFLNKVNFKDKIVPISTKILLETPLAQVGGKRPKDEEEALINITAKLDEAKVNPEFVKNAAKNDVFSVAAPRTFGAMQLIAARALIFLDSKLPRFHNVNPFLKKKFRPSSQELYKIKKYIEAIENPMKVIKEFSKGNISRESVEALSFVYPNLYERLRIYVMEDLQENVDKVDYKQRLLLGTLLNMPTDLALMPENISALQKYYSEAAVSQLGGKVPVTGAKEIDKANASATELEKLENPKRFS